MTTIAHMTLEELQAVIDAAIERKMRQQQAGTRDPRSLTEIMASIERHRWTPPPDAPSPLDLLRQDRDG